MWVVVCFHELGHLVACAIFRRRVVSIRVAGPPGAGLAIKGFKICVGVNVLAGGGVMAEECGSAAESLADIGLAWALPAAAVGVLTWLFVSRTTGEPVWSYWAAMMGFSLLMVAGIAYEWRSAKKPGLKSKRPKRGKSPAGA
jgi:hypothetical protein